MWCMCVVGIQVQTLWYINLCQLHSGKEAMSLKWCLPQILRLCNFKSSLLCFAGRGVHLLLVTFL